MGIFNRTETIEFKSFMNGSWKEEKALKKGELEVFGLGVGALVSTALKTSPAFASTSVTHRIMDAFEPIIDLAQGVSYPVAFLMLSGGMLLIMMGRRHQGLSMIKWAGIGYIGMQLVPSLMEMLVDVGNGMRGK